MSTLKLEESGEGFLEKDEGVGKKKPRGEISGDIVKVITVLMIITIADMLQIILFFLKTQSQLVWSFESQSRVKVKVVKLCRKKWYDAVSVWVQDLVPTSDESESGHIVSEKVKWA